MPDEHEPGDDRSQTPSAPTADQPLEPVPAARVVYCTNCGAQLDGLRVGEPCPNCRVPVGSGKRGGGSSGKAIASLVLGICSFLACFMYGLPGVVCAVLAIVFGNQSRKAVAEGKMPESSLGMANAGRTCGIVGLCLSVFFMLAMVAYIVWVFVWLIPQTQQNTQQHQPFQSPPFQSQPPTQPAPVQP